ncbi:MAG: hypothetical protein HKN72_10945 [Gemmatimonadetes bacterium]|nr:hypothetical protein [Gemmatimonadota bacterium]
MRRSYLFALPLAAALPAVFQACTSREVVAVVVEEVAVQPPSATVTLGDSLQLTALIQDDRGFVLRGAAPSWYSSGETIAVVDSAGMVQGLRAGSVDVSASFGSATGIARITVTPPPVYGYAVLETSGSTVVSEGVGADEFSLVLLAEPSQDVVLDIVSADPGEVEVDSTSLVFTPDDWSALRTVLVRGVVDGFVDGDQVTEVVVSVDPASDPAFAGLSPRVVAVSSLDAETAGFTVTETGGFTRVDEGESTDTLLVALDAKPASTVVLSLSSADPSEVVLDSTRLTFAPSDWATAKRVTVAGLEDGERDGDQSTLVAVSVVDEQSDELWDAVADQSVEVRTVDGSLGVRINETDGGTSVDEGGSEDSFSVVLTSPPASEVELGISVADETEVRADRSTLTFGPSNWSSPQEVTLRGVDDDAVDGTAVTPVTVEVLQGSDPAWLGQTPSEIMVTTLDDDVAGVDLTETKGSTVVAEDGEVDQVRVELSGRPVSDVIVTAVSADTTEVQVEPSVLTFTPENWDERQNFTLTGVDDEEVDGSTFTDLTISVDPSSADAFTELPPQVVTVQNADDEEEVYTIDQTGDATIVSEGGSSDTFDLSLIYRPEWSVTIRATSLDESEVTVSPSSITISRFGDWKDPRTFVVTGVDDSVPDGDQMSLILLEVEAVWWDDRYVDAPDRTVPVTTLDDDGAGGSEGSDGG